MKEYPGKITICRTTCNDRDDFCNLTVTDLDNKMVIEVDIELKEFAEALTGLGSTPCDIKSWREK